MATFMNGPPLLAIIGRIQVLERGFLCLLYFGTISQPSFACLLKDNFILALLLIKMH